MRSLTEQWGFAMRLPADLLGEAMGFRLKPPLGLMTPFIRFVDERILHLKYHLALKGALTAVADSAAALTMRFIR
jgi:hypothetical protein